MNEQEIALAKSKRKKLIVIIAGVVLFTSFTHKTHFTCDLTDCSIEKTIFGGITISKQPIGRNQIVNFTTYGYRTGKSGRMHNVYWNTRTGERYRMFTGSKHQAQMIEDKLSKALYNEKNINITY